MSIHSFRPSRAARVPYPKFPKNIQQKSYKLALDKAPFLHYNVGQSGGKWEKILIFSFFRPAEWELISWLATLG